MTAPDPSTLVFVATGALGRHLLEALIDRDTPAGSVTAAGRNRTRLAELTAAGLHTAAIDLADSSGVAELVARHPRVVLISGKDLERLAQHLSVIEAAKNSDVPRHEGWPPGGLRRRSRRGSQRC